MRPRERRLVSCALAAALLFAPVAEAKSNITFLHTPPLSATAGTPVVVAGNVFGAAEMERAVLVYRLGGGPWRRLELAREGADTYRAAIPGTEVAGAALSYYVEALDYLGDTQPIYASAAAPQRVPVAGADATAARPPESRAPAPSADDPGRPLAPAVSAGRVEQWNPDADPATAPAPARPAPPPDALADELSMFGAEDTVSLASRHQQPVSDAPGIVSVVTAEQIRALDLRTLADLAKVLPGFETSRDLQGFWRVAARGRRVDPELLVLYDGHRLNNPYDGRVPWELPLDDLERVEVIRGPGSALYGAGAFSGVVNLVPRRDPGFSGRLSYGAFGDLQGAVRGGLKLDRLRLFAAADVARRDGYVRTIARDVLTTDPDTTAGVTDDHRLGVGSSLRAEYEVAPGGPTVFAGLRLASESRGALVGLIDVVGPGSSLAWTQFLADLGVQGAVGDWAGRLRGYADDHATDRLFVLFPAGYRHGQVTYGDGVRQQTLTSLWSLGLDAAASRELGEGHSLTVGLQLERQKLSTFRYLANVNGDAPTDAGALAEPAGVRFPQKDQAYNGRAVAGLYAQDEWRLADPLRLTVGLRGDFVSGFGLNVNPRLALVYRPFEQLALKALVARAFRAPTFEESLSVVAIPPTLDSGQLQGFRETDPLRPVTVTSLELGGEAVTGVDGSRATLRANAFWNQFDDPIEPVDATGSPQLQNRPKGVRVVGAEAEARYEFTRRATTFLNLSWLRARDLATDENTPDFSLLTDVPQLRANWGLSLPVGALATLTLLAQFGSERRNDARTQLEATRRYRIPAYGLFSLVLRSRPLFERYEAALGVVNLTDLDYRDDVPRPDDRGMPGLLPREGVHATLTLRATY